MTEERCKHRAVQLSAVQHRAAEHKAVEHRADTRARTSEGIAGGYHVAARPRAEAADGKAGFQRRGLIFLHEVAAKEDYVLFGVDH